MEFHPQSLIFLTFICLLAGSAGVTWILMAYPMRIAPKPSLQFAIANFLALAGIILTMHRTVEVNYLYWLCADLMILTAFVFIRIGTAQLFKLPHNIFFDCAQLVLVATIMIFYQQDLMTTEDNRKLGVIFSLSAAITFTLASKHSISALKRDFGLSYAIFMTTPYVGLATLFVVRGVSLILLPKSEQIVFITNTVDSNAILWGYVIFTLLLNISIFGSAITRLVSKIRVLAERDQLTSLLNRRAIIEKLNSVHRRWELQGEVYSLIMFDLDHFKKINDTHGHAAGDYALRRTATLLQNILRETDFASRFGGEEFLVLLPNAHEESALAVAEKIRVALASASLVWLDTLIQLTASLGYVTAYKGCQLDQILVQVDDAMFQAKDLGRNKVCSADK